MKILKLAVLFIFCFPGILFAHSVMEFTTIEKSSYAAISERVLREAYERLGIDMRVISRPAQRAIHDANLGTVDGELYRIKDVHLKYKNLIMVPVPVGIMEGVGITTQSDLSMSGWDDLSSQRVCIRNGVKFAEKGVGDLKVSVVNSNSQLFSMLGKHRCNVIVIAHLTSIPLTLDFAKRNKTSLYQSVLQVYPLYHYLHKKNASLVPRLTAVLQEMETEGRIAAIRDAYIAEISARN
ncbi:substrate-binding periplasmic protein [Aliamphritea ceti]|uniref:substrate-binding periplasmic protein n=1 Tax=Aliamphritea ceti TaxID=1524258 RepID=UPI0021C2E996|nr:transporter substrate-binding domain-containing protein [Aliamphritea ceti]